jgi:hypothetical protein
MNMFRVLGLIIYLDEIPIIWVGYWNFKSSIITPHKGLLGS